MKRMLQTLFALCIFVTLPLSLFAQSSQAHNLVDIALNGQEVTVDGTLTDWNDAQFVFMSQDSPFFLQITNGNPVQGVPESGRFQRFCRVEDDLGCSLYSCSCT